MTTTKHKKPSASTNIRVNRSLKNQIDIVGKSVKEELGVANLSVQQVLEVVLAKYIKENG